MTWEIYKQSQLVCPVVHFTTDFSLTIQSWWKFDAAPIKFAVKWSLRNYVNDLSDGLPWHVGNFVAISYPTIELL